MCWNYTILPVFSTAFASGRTNIPWLMEGIVSSNSGQNLAANRSQLKYTKPRFARYKSELEGSYLSMRQVGIYCTAGNGSLLSAIRTRTVAKYVDLRSASVFYL